MSATSKELYDSPHGRDQEIVFWRMRIIVLDAKLKDAKVCDSFAESNEILNPNGCLRCNWNYREAKDMTSLL